MNLAIPSAVGGEAPPWQAHPWPDTGRAVVPYWVYTSDAVYRREQARLWPRSWNYVALEAEIPEPGSFVRSYAGPTPVVVMRNRDGSISCVTNRCGHRGMEFVNDVRGKARKLTCGYHQWSFDCTGCLTGIPYRRGTAGHPGMPPDFELSERDLTSLRVAVRNGVVFASLDPREESLEAWLGPRMLRWFDRTFDGRELVILGRHLQDVPAKWLIYMDNLRDPYHGGLLHYFFRAFHLASADEPGGVEISDDGLHSVLLHYRAQTDTGQKRDGEDGRGGLLTLQDQSILELWPEQGRGTDGPSTTMQAIGYNLVVGTQNNSLNTRQIIPLGPRRFRLVWTMFGYHDDSPALREHRALQSAALQGPAGAIPRDDAEAFAMTQAGIDAAPLGEHALIEMGGRDHKSAATVTTEAPIRGFYYGSGGYRRDMEL